MAILKAGGAYVPIDSELPPARLMHIIDDARISVLVSERRLVTELNLPQVRVVCIDDEADKISQQPGGNPESRSDGDNAAYVIYTSGSTGAPKGVVIAHRGVCNAVAAMVQAFPVRPESCVLQFASLSFDGSVQEILTALTTGARLCLVSRETLLSGRRLAEYAQEQKVTVATLPPSMLAVLSPEEWPALETVVSAGERCPAETAARWSRRTRFINGYGPTEATIGAAIYEHDATRTGDPPIGRPLSNTRTRAWLGPSFLCASRNRRIGGKGGRVIAAKYAETIREVQSDGPYFPGGWSTGGVVAFEMARQLQARGADVALVTLLDSMAPGDYSYDIDDDRARGSWRILKPSETTIRPRRQFRSCCCARQTRTTKQRPSHVGAT